LPIGGGGNDAGPDRRARSAGQRPARGGAAAAPVAAHNLDELGEHLTAGGAVGDVATAGAFGGLLGGGFHAAGDARPPVAVQGHARKRPARWAGKMKVGDGKRRRRPRRHGQSRARGFRAIDDRRAHDARRKSAADTLEREQELGEASPFMAGPAGDAAHSKSLATRCSRSSMARRAKVQKRTSSGRRR
jgi:hypothetical protein